MDNDKHEKFFLIWMAFCGVVGLVVTGIVCWGFVEGILWVREQ